MKNLIRTTLFALLLTFAHSITAQTEKVGFLVIESTDNFEEAQHIATEIADSLHLEFRNEYLYDKEEGLIDTVTCGCGYQHGYLRRGRYNHGQFVSIELNERYSNSPDGETYAIIAMSYSIKDKEAKEHSNLIKSKYPTAKFFKADIYVGCMH